MNNRNRRLGFIPLGKPVKQKKIVRREVTSPYVPNPFSPSKQREIVKNTPEPQAVPLPPQPEREKTPA